MKHIFLLLLSLTTPALTTTAQTVKRPSPRQMFPGLFEAVQTAQHYPDSKTFADAIPKVSPAVIRQAYAAASRQPGFDLKKFTDQYFLLPQAAGPVYKTDTTQTAEAHIEHLWSVLERKADPGSNAGSLIPLPHPYIVPGGRFREVYYWDSYFTMLGLRESGRTELMENILDNFAYLLRTYGFIPNGNRTYYLTRSQPPFFALMVELLMDAKPAEKKQVLQRYRDVLEKEYHYWMQDAIRLPDGALLNRYRDRGNWPREESWTEDINTAKGSDRPAADTYRELRSGAASGWDYSSRWLADAQHLATIHVTDIFPVDLNCLLYAEELLLAKAFADNASKAGQYRRAATRRQQAIQKYCWDARQGWYYDYDFKAGKPTPSLNLAGMYPLFSGIARQGQADSAAVVIRQHFLQPGGLVTTPLHTGQQWDAPNGWAPLQWISIAGLLRYHQDTLASTIAQRWTRLNEKTFQRTGKLLEKYNVMDTTLPGGGGEYPNQDGFGWTNGVLLQLIHLQRGVSTGTHYQLLPARE